MGYEFGSHGTQFQKPVTLGIAYQDDKGIWQGRDNLVVLAAQHRVVAPVYHFSRYSFYENFWLNPIDKTLAPNETVEFKVFYQENSMKFPGSIDDSENSANSAPANTLNVPGESDLGDMLHSLVYTVHLLKANQVRNWRVNGQGVIGKVESPIGFLSYHESNSVIYKAPAKAPEANSVNVSVEVITPGKGKLILIRNMTIESPNVLYIGGAKYDPAFAEASVGAGYLSLAMTGTPAITANRPTFSFSLSAFRDQVAIVSVRKTRIRFPSLEPIRGRPTTHLNTSLIQLTTRSTKYLVPAL